MVKMVKYEIALQGFNALLGLKQFFEENFNNIINAFNTDTNNSYKLVTKFLLDTEITDINDEVYVILKMLEDNIEFNTNRSTVINTKIEIILFVCEGGLTNFQKYEKMFQYRSLLLLLLAKMRCNSDIKQLINNYDWSINNYIEYEINETKGFGISCSLDINFGVSL